MGFPAGSDSKESAWNVEDLGWSLSWEDSLEEGTASQSNILAWGIPMDKGAWQATVYRVTKSQTRLRNSAEHIASMAQEGTVTKDLNSWW